MKNSILVVIGLVLLGMGLSSCDRWRPYGSDLDHKPAICKRLKRQMIYNTMNRNTEAAWQTPSQRARLRQLYREHDCE